MYLSDNTSEGILAKSTTEPFNLTLAKHSLHLTRGKVSTLQINVGLLCNQVCKHCHLEAGPTRHEVMSKETIRQVVVFAKKHHFDCIDITGGAPEMNPNLTELLKSLGTQTHKLLLRSNLTAITNTKQQHLIDLCKQNKVGIVASFPSINETQAEGQRGKGNFNKSLETLKQLNSIGYGQPGTELELNLVANPTGAFLPSSQQQTERRFRKILLEKWDLVFNNLYTFANVPLGRFYKWLIHSGNFAAYLEKLSTSFNPCAIDGLMCRTLLSVSWDGYLYDCDFNQALGLFMGNNKTHISELHKLPKPGSAIAIADHCYTCTAGSGFT